MSLLQRKGMLLEQSTLLRKKVLAFTRILNALGEMLTFECKCWSVVFG